MVAFCALIMARRGRKGRVITIEAGEIQLTGQGGMQADARWRAGDETIKDRALARVKAHEAYVDAVRSRLPDDAPSCATRGRRSHLEVVRADMRNLHEEGRLPDKLASACRLLHERDVARCGSENAALKVRTLQNKLSSQFHQLWTQGSQ